MKRGKKPLDFSHCPCPWQRVELDELGGPFHPVLGFCDSWDDLRAGLLHQDASRGDEGHGETRLESFQLGRGELFIENNLFTKLDLLSPSSAPLSRISSRLGIIPRAAPVPEADGVLLIIQIPRGTSSFPELFLLPLDKCAREEDLGCSNLLGASESPLIPG